jgi:uncharacterized protein YraI
MNVTIIRKLLLICLILVFTFCLCACDLMDSVYSMLGMNSGSDEGPAAESELNIQGALAGISGVEIQDQETDFYNNFVIETPEATSEETEDPYGLVVCDILNVRSGPGTDYDVTEMIELGTRLEIYEVRMREGMAWAKVQYGWVSLDYVRLSDPSMIEGEYVGSHMGTVWVLSATLREGPGEHYDVVGSVSSNQRIEYDTRCSNWVRYGEVWLCLDEVQLDGTVSQRWGTVNGTDVNIRTGPDTDYAICGKANTGDRLVIYETTDKGGRRWGRCDQGWICMDYVDLDY